MSNKFKSKTIIGGLLLCSLAIGAGAFADHDNMVHHSSQRISLASKNKELAPKAKKSKDIMEQIKPEYEKYCTYGNHKGSQSWSDPDFISEIQDEIKQVYNDKNNDDLHNTGAFSRTGWAKLSKQNGYKESYDAHMLAGLYDGISGYYQNHKHDTVSPTHKADRTSDQNYTGNLTRFPSTKMNDISIEKHGAARKGAEGTHVLGNHNVEKIHETDDNDPLPKYTHYWYANLKSKDLGNYDEGAPYHKYPVKDFIYNGPEYSQYLGYWHSHLETTNLEHHMGKYSRDVLKVVNPSGNVVVDYPKSTTVKLNGNGQLADDGKKTVVDTVLTVSNLRKYTPWDNEPRSLVFSKNLYAGFMQNGYTDFNVSYQFKDPKTHKDINLGNGQQNPQSNPNTNKNSNAHAFLRFRQINGLGAYYDTKTYKYNGVDAWTNNEYWLQSGSTADKAAEFVNDAGNTGQKEFYVGRHSKIRSIKSPVFNYDHVIGGQYNSHYPYSKYNNTHDVIFKLNGDSASFHTGSTVGYSNVQPQTKMIGKIKTKYICKKYTYKEPNGTKSTPAPSQLIKYINIVINRDGQNSKAIPLSDFVGKNAKQHVNQTMFKHTTVNGQTNGDGGNYKKATILVGPKKKQYREFKNDKQAVKWASNINCLVVKPPKPQPCKQGSKQCPTQKFQKTVMKKGPDGSIHVPDHKIEDYDNGDYYNGGILKHPNQKYDYKIHGQLPLLDKQAYYYKSSTDSKGHTTYSSTPTYYDDSRDNFVLNDTIPSEVKMLSVPQMKVNGQSISATSGMSHNMQFKFNESQLAGLQSGGTQPTYDVIIPVEAAPKSGSNKDFDSSQKGYGLPDVTGSSYKHWLSFLNKSNFSSDIHVGYNGSTNEPDSKKSNALVNIKEIKATIYNYNYNKNYYPNSEQPYGFNFNKSCNKTSTDPTSRYYKDYRYHSKRAKAHKIGDPLYYYGYVNSDFAVRSLEKDQGKHTGQHGTEEWRYRLVYPSLPVKGYLPATNSSENNNSVWNINSKRYQAAKDSISNDWSKKDPNYWADNDNANNALPMVFNPDDLHGKCGNDAYTSSGFSQTNYIPYIVPHISFIPEIPDELKNLPKTARLNRDGQLIVDTDSAKHGLPFRFNMRAQNVLYGYHFWNDFKDDNGNPDMVTMHVTAGKGKHAPELYKATRRLVGNKSNSLARFNSYKHQHYVTKDEWPKGNHNWTGYDEADAFKAKNSSQYDLDISKLHPSKGEKIPLHVYFTSTGLARISYRNLDSHAYNAAKPKVMRKTNKSFGYTHNGSDSVKGNNNPNKSTYIEPERTVKYFGESPNDPDKQVRELKEELNVTQPHHAYGKTGYGMTANDLGISYAGHLEEPRYVHKGTNMTYAFPSPFQKKDTHIKYSKDNRHSGKLSATIYKNDNKSTKTAYKRLADVLLHVEPHSQSHQVTTSNGIDNGMPSNLDDPNGIKYYADADNYYGDFLNKEHLWSGKFATSYGFYPRQATHNVRTSSNGIDSNGGDITIAPHGPSGIESKRYDDKPVSDVKMLGDLPHTMNGFNGYGLNGVKTNNGMTHDFNTITKTQGVKDAQMSNEDIKADGQDERMFTPIFMNTGWYSTNFHRSYRQMNRKHRLGGNFFDIDENRPIKFYGHIYIAKNSKSKENDEFSLQPILSNTKNGLSQTPSSAPLFPTDWLSSADGSMAPNWYDAKIFAKKHKHHGHKRWSMNIGTHQKELEKKY